MKLANKIKNVLFVIGILNFFVSLIICSSVEVRNRNKVEGKNKNSNTLSNSMEISSKNKNKVETQEKLNVKEKIFVSQKFLKKKLIKNKQNESPEISSTILSSDSELAKKTNLMSVVGLESNTDSDLNLGKGPIYLQGWVKIFKYSDSELLSETPKHFFRNNEYFEQMKLYPHADLKMKEENMNVYIKDPTYFFVVVFNKNINFLSSRQIQLQKTYDSINIDSILPVQEYPGYKKGGVLDFGNFNEGFCFKVVVKLPKQTNWVICTESGEEKNNFMSIIKKLKLKQQRDNGIINVPNPEQKKETISEVLNPEDSSTKKLEKDSKGNLSVTFDSNQKIIDGYWIVLQDWTQCSLKCGGGTSTMQRMCVPPKNGGNTCTGPNILTRACNTKPCPNILTTSQKNSTSTVINLKPVVKVMPFSSRPQRYIKCIIKESDLMMTQQTNTFNGNNPDIEASTSSDIKSLQIPTRVVMNNRTLTIFGGEDYNTLIMVFNIADTYFKRSQKHPECFFISENNAIKQAELCPFGCNNVKTALEEWDYDFNLFKYQCSTSNARDLVNVNEEALNEKYNEKISNAKKELIEERERQVKKKLEEKEENDLENVVKTTNQVALQAIQKELNLEEMIKHEESQKEAQEELEILNAIEHEKKKSECILKVIKERKIDNQYNLRIKQTEEEVQNIKQSTAQQVIIKRNQLKTAILQMRKKADLRKQKLKQQLMSVRMSVAKEMGNAYKKGDMNKCVQALNSEDNRNIYCQANFLEEYNILQNCKEGEDFITICCDNEFGEFYLSERQKCYGFVKNQAIVPQSNNIDDLNKNPLPPKGLYIWSKNNI